MRNAVHPENGGRAAKSTQSGEYEWGRTTPDRVMPQHPVE
jgi:hypothetical protein